MRLMNQISPKSSAPVSALWDDLQAAKALVSAVGDFPLQLPPPLPQ